MARRYRFLAFEFEEKDKALLQKIGNLASDKIEEIIELLNAVDFTAELRQERNQFSEKLAAKVEALTEDEGQALFYITQMALSESTETELDDDELETLLSLKEFDEPVKTNLLTVLKGVHEGSNFYQRERIVRATETGPSRLTGFIWTVDIRGVFRKKYQYEEQNIVDYEPEIESTVPIAMLEFMGDQPFDKQSYQVNERDLDRLINELLAAQKELLKLKENWGG